MENDYENELFKEMADYVKDRAGTSAPSEETLVLQSLHFIHFMGQTRSGIFNKKEISALKSSIHPLSYDLMTFKGACTSYAFILSRLLNELHITTRIAQMRVNGLYGGHILVEAKMAKGWAVLDGNYDLCFRKRDGGLASFADVQGHWNSYHNQVPANYNEAYRYEGVRYTNWNKIPIVMPLLKDVFYLFLGHNRTESLSLRTMLLNKYRILFRIIIGLFLFEALAAIYIYWRKYGKPVTANSHGSFQIKNAPINGFKSKIDQA
ncbi:hypothetical protein A3860_22920 [Niastella vici]|uniref:Transglutaminase-like domain-containing protein n=2 Tax=Niastella vici TaxID=1703345 RepID=A0A1V9FZJ3_9BACT|nr:hypothetical protein A3860_22920 [Niastella vici]